MYPLPKNTSSEHKSASKGTRRWWSSLTGDVVGVAAGVEARDEGAEEETEMLDDESGPLGSPTVPPVVFEELDVGDNAALAVEARFVAVCGRPASSVTGLRRASGCDDSAMRFSGGNEDKIFITVARLSL